MSRNPWQQVAVKHRPAPRPVLKAPALLERPAHAGELLDDLQAGNLDGPTMDELSSGLTPKMKRDLYMDFLMNEGRDNLLPNDRGSKGRIMKDPI